MRTSQQQFELMCTFMEKHGDLSIHPWASSGSRISNILLWEELSSLLNNHISGDTKSTEGWKRVWSDLKNNTKRKAVRLHKAASRTDGGGPVVRSKLRDFEQRVLNLIEKEATTRGLAVDDAGFSQEVHIKPSAVSVNAQSPSPVIVIKLEQNAEACNEPGISSRSHEVPMMRHSQSHSKSPSPHYIHVDDEIIEDTEACNEPGALSRSHEVPMIRCSQSHSNSPSPRHIHVDHEIIEGSEESNQPSDLATQPHVALPVSEVQPACSGQTTPRHNRRTRRTLASLRRPARSSRTDVAQQFVHSNIEWRELRMQQHRDYMDMRREQNRIREMEVLAHREWQTIGLRALGLLNKLVTKYCRDKESISIVE